MAERTQQRAVSDKRIHGALAGSIPQLRRHGLRALEISKEDVDGWEEITSVGDTLRRRPLAAQSGDSEDVYGPGEYKGAIVVCTNGRRARKVPRTSSRGRQYRFRRTESQILAIGADLALDIPARLYQVGPAIARAWREIAAVGCIRLIPTVP